MVEVCSPTAVPLHRAPQAFFEIYFGFVAESGFCLRDVGQRVFDVAAAFWAVVGLSLIGCQILQQLEGFVEGDSAAGGDIEDLSRCLGRGSFAGQQIALRPRCQCR